MKYLTTLLFLIASVTCSWSQGTMLLRQPDIHNDMVVFVYANDLWISSSSGGDAHRLTSSTGAETDPHFSPGGEWIAFTAQYDGNTDVYVIPSAGGEPVRLTWHPGPDRVQGWMPDGERVLFQSGREGQPTKSTRLYCVPVKGGTPEPLPVVRAAYGQVSPDARYLAYTPITFWDPEWRNYRGGQAQPIWIVDLETLDLKQTPRSDNERHLDPVWVGDRVFFLSELDYASNIWSYDPSVGNLRQHTFHGDFDVKNLESDGTNIIYEQGGHLHLLDPSDNSQKKLEITVRGDFHWARERWEDVNPASLSEARLSASGQRVIAEYRGEIFSIPAEKGSWRNLSSSPGVADRSPVWSPQGNRIAWFSDEGGEYGLVIASQDGKIEKRIDIPGASFFFRPEWSPDGKKIAFTDTHYTIWSVNLETGTIKKVDTDTYAHPNRTMNPVWSPDSRWIAYAKLLDSQFKAIYVYNTENGIGHRLTDGMADAISPVWDASGKYLWFLASTNFGLGTGWLDMSSYDVVTTRSLYIVLLGNETASPFLPESDEEKAAEKEDKPDPSATKKSSDKKKNSNDKGENEISEKKVIIDPVDIGSRILRCDIPDANYPALVEGPEGTVFVLESKPGSRTMNLNKYSLDKREMKQYMEGVSMATVSADRSKLLYRAGSTWGITETKAASAKAGDGKLNISGMRVKIDPRKEWEQIYREGWRFQRDFLYVDNVHGAPWDKVYEWYLPWVSHVRHRSEMSYIIDILGGEVAVGHSYTSGGDFPEIENVPVGLLGVDFKTESGSFRLTKIYTGESWNEEIGPLAHPGMKVSEGDYIVSVNGKRVSAENNFFSYFEGTAGLQTRLGISDTPSGENTREVVVIPLSSDRGLRTNDWVERNRRLVDSLSGGKLAYVWLPNTGQGGYSYFNRYYFAQQDKQGAVIDERNNGGGSAADYIVDILNRDLMGYFNSKAGERRPFTTPMAGLWGPKVMIINERAGSGGDLMPFLFKEMNIGPLVGTRTWGGLVGTWDTPRFIDGGRMVAPRGGFFNTDGEWDIEGTGISPDIEVMQLPAEEAKGNDPQLIRAVQEALKLIETEGVKLKPEPDPPVRWKRPQYFKGGN